MTGIGHLRQRIQSLRDGPKWLAAGPRLAAIGCLRLYRYTLSAILGRQCRYLPTCSAYAEDAIVRHGLWAGGWMGFARVCRCGPNGGSGFDPAPEALPEKARWYLPWRYGRWRFPDELGRSAAMRCDEVGKG